MDPRRRLTVPPAWAPGLVRSAALSAAALALAACAGLPPLTAPAPIILDGVPPGLASLAAPEPPPAEPAIPVPSAHARQPERPVVVAMAPIPNPPGQGARRRPQPEDGRIAIAAANRQARTASTADAFVGGVQVFRWEPGRLYEVWAAPLRVTTLTLPPGETVTAKAAGDTIRWQIGESVSGEGADARVHVLVKPMEVGLETNLVLTTSRRVYMIQLRSGPAAGFNAAVAWDADAPAFASTPPPTSLPAPAPAALPPDLSPVRPDGPVHARYRLEPQGRIPAWIPVAVFDDGRRTFIVLPDRALVRETPVLFDGAGEAAQLVNYRQSDRLLIADRLFDRAELRLGGPRPEIVRLVRLPEARP